MLEKVLYDKVMFTKSSVKNFLHIITVDMYLEPDLNIFLILLLELNEYGKVVHLICSVKMINDKYFEGYYHHNLQKVLFKMKELNFSKFDIGVEPCIVVNFKFSPIILGFIKSFSLNQKY